MRFASAGSGVGAAVTAAGGVEGVGCPGGRYRRRADRGRLSGGRRYGEGGAVKGRCGSRAAICGGSGQRAARPGAAASGMGGAVVGGAGIVRAVAVCERRVGGRRGGHGDGWR